jgi:hypothetical protein
MKTRLIQAEAKANFSRFNPTSDKGFYESYFIRANHPTEKQAFWIRYTVFSPKESPEKNMGELWAIYFDGKDIYPAKTEFPIENCKFPNKHFYVEIGDNILNSAQARGKAGKISWKLKFSSTDNALFLLPLNYYNSPFPKAKSIVSQPFANFTGHIKVGKEKFVIDNWIGSQNHNWGEKHTDYYAWGQVVGFDNSPDTFLELITAKLILGGIETPFLTILVLRHKGKEYQINSLGSWFLNKGSFDYFNWEFECRTKEIEIKGRIKAKSADFVGLRYHNPAGGDKNCLNSKVASCELQIEEKSKAGMPQALYSADKCAFEILTNEGQEYHGIKINF